MITQIKLDQPAKLQFGVNITGADSTPTARFIIEGKGYSLMFPCSHVNENVEVEIPVLKNLIAAGEYAAKLEIVLDNKLYTPLQESIVFEPSIEIKTEQKAVKLVKESVKVSSIVVKKPQIDESLLRKTQAANIIAGALKYTPAQNQTPAEIIEQAINDAGEMTAEQAKTVEEMLKLAESVGIEVVVSPKVKITITEEKQEKVEVNPDDMSDEELDDIASSLEDDDYYDAYDDDELAVVDDESGEQIDEDINESELNEVLSRAERMKARIRMARTKVKREAKLKIALKKHSSVKTLTHRARRLAINAMKQRLAKKPLSQLSVSEKERIERIIARRKNAIDRLAMKLTPKVRQIEKDRLSHRSFTQK